jgi:hypothetical protein
MWSKKGSNRPTRSFSAFEFSFKIEAAKNAWMANRYFVVRLQDDPCNLRKFNIGESMKPFKMGK